MGLGEGQRLPQLGVHTVVLGQEFQPALHTARSPTHAGATTGAEGLPGLCAQLERDATGQCLYNVATALPFDMVFRNVMALQPCGGHWLTKHHEDVACRRMFVTRGIPENASPKDTDEDSSRD